MMDYGNLTNVVPRNIAAETALLSLAFMGNDLSEVFELLESGDFYDTAHQQIWQALLGLYRSGKAIDVVVLQDELREQNLEVEATIEVVLRLFQSPSVVGGNAGHFAEEIKNAAILRKLLSVLDTATQQTQVTGTKPKAVISELEKGLIDLSQAVIDKRPQDLKGILAEVEVDIENTIAHGWQAALTGFPTLDEITGGLIPTHVWILGAYTGTGKSLFLNQIILSLLKQGKVVLLISTEMDRKMIMLRLLANLSGIRPLKIMRGLLNDYEIEQVEKAKEELRTYQNQLFIVDNVYTSHEIRLKAKKVKLEVGTLDLVIVDFIQNLQGAESIYERMSQAAIDLQETAQVLGVAMLIASQVSQQGATRVGKQEVIEYKGAGEIAAIADVGLWLSRYTGKEMRDSGYEDERLMDGGIISYRKLSLLKVRHGEPGRMTLKMSFPAGTISEIQSEQPKPPGKVVDQQESFDDFEP